MAPQTPPATAALDDNPPHPPACRHIVQQTGALAREHFAAVYLQGAASAGVRRIDANGNFVSGDP
jgi:hypothetical protein